MLRFLQAYHIVGFGMQKQGVTQLIRRIMAEPESHEELSFVTTLCVRSRQEIAGDLVDFDNRVFGVGQSHRQAQSRKLGWVRWTDAQERFLKRPYFPTPIEALKPLLIAQSPIAFRRRMIFVEHEPLRRARMPVERA